MCSTHSYKALHVLSQLILTTTLYTDEETERWTKRVKDFPTITQLVSDGVWSTAGSPERQKNTQKLAYRVASARVGSRTRCYGSTKKRPYQDILSPFSPPPLSLWAPRGLRPSLIHICYTPAPSILPAAQISTELSRIAKILEYLPHISTFLGSWRNEAMNSKN